VTQAGAAWRLRCFETLPSTSDLCVSLAMAGEPEGLAALAARQTRGRGSRGRFWEAPPGNLNLSVLLRPAGDPAEAGRWALLAGVALAEALAPHVPHGLSLKWPNDVLLGGAKLAGILIDSALRPEGGLDWLVLGLGANLAHSPDLPDRAAACLPPPAPAPRAVAEAVLNRLSHWRRVRAVEGFGAVRTAWLARAHRPGTQLTLRLGQTVIGGLFAGLADDGSLLLQTGGRVRAFQTAEVLQGREV
jgi:BirA family transcriptional regulator, biotin operon repressor / biotin---[acetyl-CoA-carboxylase] ligase